MQFSKSLQGSKLAITMRPVSIESTYECCYFFLNRNALWRHNFLSVSFFNFERIVRKAELQIQSYLLDFHFKNYYGIAEIYLELLKINKANVLKTSYSEGVA